MTDETPSPEILALVDALTSARMGLVNAVSSAGIVLTDLTEHGWVLKRQADLDRDRTYWPNGHCRTCGGHEHRHRRTDLPQPRPRPARDPDRTPPNDRLPAATPADRVPTTRHVVKCEHQWNKWGKVFHGPFGASQDRTCTLCGLAQQRQVGP
jgi:hypothetical protein